MNINNPISYQIWEDRYKKDCDNTVEDNLKRVAKYCSFNDKEEQELFDLMNNKYFFYAGRVMSNAAIGKDLTMNNCFTLNSVEDSIEGIFEKVKIGALTQQKGGGTGYDFSLIRPKGTPTSNDAVASGVVSFMDVFNSQTNTILQGGRRGANMGLLNIYHPDIYEYLEAKSWDEGKLTHFNVSIMVDDDFMKAVENDESIYLHYPVYDEKSHIIKDESKWTHKKQVRATELWDLIMTKAYNTGEYGVLFYDNLNRDNNTWYIETIVTTNPCAEYVAGTIFKEDIESKDYMGACNLGYIMLHSMIENPFTEDAYFDFNLFEDVVKKSVRYLDNIIDINNYPHEAFENYQKNMRTIGLGTTGWADMFAMLNLKYGSKESLDLADDIAERLSYHSYESSIELSKEKGQFPFLQRNKFIKSNFIQKHLTRNGDWQNIIYGIMKYGIRNARCLSIAPVGTGSLTYGENCSSGVEPIIMLESKREVKIGGQDDNDKQVVELRDYAYNEWLKVKDNEDIIVNKDVFVTAMELSVEEHVDMLSTIAFHIDQSVSKTINIPTSYPYEDAKQVYMDCWKRGVKGCTIFRPNKLRKGIFITEEQENEEQILNYGQWRPLASDTVYHPRKIHIGCGKLKLMVGWSNTENRIQDLYVIRTGQGGCEKNLQAMVIMMSGMLRLGGNIFNIEKALDGVGACNSFVSKRVKGGKLSKGNSCGTAILNEIRLFLKERDNKVIEEEIKELNNTEKEYLKQHGEIAFAKKFSKCPQCLEELTHNDGCIICPHCGWTKC